MEEEGWWLGQDDHRSTAFPGLDHSLGENVYSLVLVFFVTWYLEQRVGLGVRAEPSPFGNHMCTRGQRVEAMGKWKKKIMYKIQVRKIQMHKITKFYWGT